MKPFSIASPLNATRDAVERDIQPMAASETVNLPYIPDADECRTCGQCIGHCPTFSLKHEENENPRGRLRVIARVLHDNSRLARDERQSLHNCLQCRACERICPSKVAYGELINLALEKIKKQAWPSRLLLHPRLWHRTTLNAIARILRLYQRSGLRHLVRTTHLLPRSARRLEALLPEEIYTGDWQPLYPALGARRGTVALFLGCVGSRFDHMTRVSAIKLLNHLGYDVFVPQRQQCCGALHAHNGAPEVADQFATTNLRAFTEQEFDAILYCDSGCGAMLREYDRITTLEPATKQGFIAKLQDVSGFIADDTWPQDITINQLAITVAVHEPCTQRFPLGDADNAYQLLKRIPGLTLVPLANNHRCCGAGGLHMLTTPAIAEPLADAKLEAIRQSGATLVVTSNIGCLMHIGATLRTKHADIELVHPLTFLGRQLKSMSSRPTHQDIGNDL